MTTEDLIVHIFYHVDHALKDVAKVAQAQLYPSEVVTIGILFALKGGHFRAFYRWLKRDYEALFAGLPDRTSVQRQLKAQQGHTDRLLGEASLLCVVDSFPIELRFPIREGRSAQQIGGKNKASGRWSVGIKLCWIINTDGAVVGWKWLPMNHPDQDFHPLIRLLADESVVLADLGFRCAKGLPANLKLCPKGTWNERMRIETVFSLLTVVCQAKHLFHRLSAYLEARLAYTAAMFNTLRTLFHHLHPDADPHQLSIAEFSL